jgi:DNA-binding NarL/FixJ family response regulator
MAGLTNIILIESSFLLRSGIESLVQEIPGMLISDVFEGVEKNLVEKIKSKKPDLVIVNPDSLGDIFISFISLLQNNTDVEVVGLLRSDCQENISSRFKNSLIISENKHNLLAGLRKICGNSANCKKNDQGPISKREIIILTEVVKGLTNQEIADKLFLSIHTVMTHRKNITKKLGIKTVSGLIVYSLMNNIVDINEMR